MLGPYRPSRPPLTRDITYWGEASMRARAVPEGRPVRCGELIKGMFDPGLGTSFRTRLIEELDVLCRLAARFKHYYEKAALTEDAF